jgi:N-acetylglucosamine-6-phosphate deacetylase
MTTLRIAGGDLLTPFEVIEDGVLFARDGVIAYAGPRHGAPAERAGVEVDASGRTVCPGFVDLQVNGGGGALLTAEPTRETVARMCAAHVRFGTTALLPTAVTSSETQMARALAAVAAAVDDQPGGARVLGAHLEGPFINPLRKGAHDERFIAAPDLALFERLAAASGGTLRLITVAPELPGALELYAAARRAGVAVSIGHTDATYEEARAAIGAGASFATHLFNAMRPVHQREPGVIAGLLEAEIATGLIADGVHVHPALLALAAREKGERAVLVTDAMSPVGSDETSFSLYGGEVVVRDGSCYTKDGVLAGSALSMDRAVRTMIERAGVPLLDAVRMATAAPAAVLGLEREIGVLRRGARADVVVCDRDVNVERVFVGGALAHEA